MTNTDKPHHTRGGFQNEHIENKRILFDFLKWRWEHFWKNMPSSDQYDFPVADNDPQFLRSNTEKITLTWIGHATILFQVRGKNVLTDPHFSERVSPVQWAGPRRVVPPGVALEELPSVDIVVISHDHYDSLDKQTIQKLYEREGGKNIQFYVPLGLKSWFSDLGITRVNEMDWWDEDELEDLKIIAVPIQHWSKRSLFSKNKTLWAGWIIMSDVFRFFFAGDSGYSSYFKEIGRKLGPFDLSAIPIGAYEPRWFMKNHHMNPEEAVQVHLDIHSRKSVAIHWGTFMLTDEPLDEPPIRLKKAREKKGVSEEEFFVVKHGKTIHLDQEGEK